MDLQEAIPKTSKNGGGLGRLRDLKRIHVRDASEPKELVFFRQDLRGFDQVLGVMAALQRGIVLQAVSQSALVSSSWASC